MRNILFPRWLAAVSLHMRQPCVHALLSIPRYPRYNLGWLPGGDKSITTKLEDTLESIEAAKRLVKHGGMISVMLYRGHAEVSELRVQKGLGCCDSDGMGRSFPDGGIVLLVVASILNSGVTSQ